MISERTKHKRRIALLLISSMLLSLISFTAFAEDDDSMGTGDAQSFIKVETMEGLQQAIHNADDNPTIITIDQDITFKGEVTIPQGKNIIIAGQGHTLTQAATARHFQVNGTLTLQDVTLTSAEANGKGGIQVGNIWTKIEGKLVLENGTIISGNTATSATNGGGGVYVSNGELMMNDGKITNNTAYDKGGGVMITKGTFTMKGGEITNNSAWGHGGGVYTQDTFIMNGGTIGQNKSAANSPGKHLGSGGGVYVHGNSRDVSFSMNGGEITGNQALGSDGLGGGVFLIAGGILTMNDGQITDNEAPRAGGGVYVNGYCQFVLGNGVISGNKAGQTGGGVYTTTNSEFSMNGGSITSNTSINGGGMYLNSEFTMNNGTIANNRAIFSETNTNSGQDGRGGGIFAQKSVTIENESVIKGNRADGSGGGIYANERWPLAIYNSTIGGESEADGNVAGFDGGGIWKVLDMLIIENSNITGNTAEDGNGGGIHVGYIDDVRILDSTISHNLAGHKILLSSGNGGGINFSLDSPSKPIQVDMHNVIISDNIAHTSGGGINILGPFDLTISQGKVTQNKAATTLSNLDGDGGGLSMSGITGRGADENKKPSVLITDETSFVDNTANHGGAIFCDESSGSLTIAGSLISDNKSNYGGGIYRMNNTPVNIEKNTVISGNKAAFDGGGIWTPYSLANWSSYEDLTIASDTEFTKNTAEKAYDFGSGDKTTYPDIQWTNVSIPNTHALNNYDVHYKGDHTLHTITYNPNGGTGETYTTWSSKDAKHTVLSPGSIDIGRDNYDFYHWNTDSEGIGLGYEPDFEISDINSDISLYAIWTQKTVSTCTVTYHFNDDSGKKHTETITKGAIHTVLSPSSIQLSRSGYKFTGWAENADGTGEKHETESDITVNDSMDLYAIWNKNSSGGGGGGNKKPQVKPEVKPDPEVKPEVKPDSEEKPEIKPATEPADTSAQDVPTPDPTPTPGGRDIEPRPHPGRTVMPGNNTDTYIELDVSGVPLGEWTKQDDGIWIFNEYTPLGDLPRTGHPDDLLIFMIGLIATGALLMLFRLNFGSKGRQK